MTNSKPALSYLSTGQNLFFNEEPPATRHQIGGAERDRTDDLLNANQALSQLSYTPILLQSAPVEWWAWEDLNFRPHAYQARALTN